MFDCTSYRMGKPLLQEYILLTMFFSPTDNFSVFQSTPYQIDLVSVIGFAILPRDWELGHKDTFVYNSWRMFVLACGLPSLLAAILISRMPESPRFLLLQGHHDKTRRVLVHMFVTNTKLPPESYHVSIAKTHKSIFKLKCFTNLLKVSCLRKAITV